MRIVSLKEHVCKGILFTSEYSLQRNTLLQVTGPCHSMLGDTKRCVFPASADITVL